jgi:hypothetical protein
VITHKCKKSWKNNKNVRKRKTWENKNVKKR